MPDEYPNVSWGYTNTTGERCVICDLLLTNAFPEDFPDEFKFCCTCKEIAFEMINGDLPPDWWIYIRADKIKKIITLVG